MSVHSSQTTAVCLASPNPEAKQLEIWKQTRYLVAQRATTETSNVTNDMFYQGRAVIPGPLANQELTGSLMTTDLPTLQAKHSIQFTDFQTTAGAGAELVEAHYTVMSNVEADAYEKELRKALNDGQNL